MSDLEADDITNNESSEWVRGPIVPVSEEVASQEQAGCKGCASQRRFFMP